jgi:hypothetical protein
MTRCGAIGQLRVDNTDYTIILSHMPALLTHPSQETHLPPTHPTYQAVQINCLFLQGANAATAPPLPQKALVPKHLYLSTHTCKQCWSNVSARNNSMPPQARTPPPYPPPQNNTYANRHTHVSSAGQCFCLQQLNAATAPLPPPSPISLSLAPPPPRNNTPVSNAGQTFLLGEAQCHHSPTNLLAPPPPKKTYANTDTHL